MRNNFSARQLLVLPSAPIKATGLPARGPGHKLRLLVLLLVLSCCSAGSAFAQQEVVQPQTFGLEPQELQVILQKCVDLPAMQKYYPMDATGRLQPVNIMQLPIAFPAAVSPRKGGQPVNFISTSKAEFSRRAKPAAYAMFRSIEHTDDLVKVRFNYFYKAGAEQRSEPLFVEVELKKAGTDWAVVTSSVKE